MTRFLRNFATLEKYAAEILIGGHEEDNVRIVRNARFTISRPLERQPFGAVLTNPIDELVRLFKVAYVGAPPAGGDEPYIHRDARRSVIDIDKGASHLAEIRLDGQATYVRLIRSSVGLNLAAELPRETLQSIRSTMLYLSMVLEMAVKSTGLVMGDIELDVDFFVGVGKQVEGIRALEEFPDAYTDGAGMAPSSLVDDNLFLWANEVDLCRRNGAVGLQSPSVRHILVPILMAQRELADDNIPIETRVSKAAKHVASCAAEDWRTACMAWLQMLVQQKEQHA